MLNRTNLTLSARSNRLHLGTRSFVLATNHNTDGQETLRIRHAHQDVMREEMGRFGVPSIPSWQQRRIGASQPQPVSCSLSQPSGHSSFSYPLSEPESALAETAAAEPRALASRSVLCEGSVLADPFFDPSYNAVASGLDRVKGRKPVTKRGLRLSGKAGRGRAARRAARDAAPVYAQAVEE